MRSIKRLPLIFWGAVALVGGVVVLVLRQRSITEQVPAEKATSSSYRQTPLWRAYDRVAEKLDRAVGWYKVPTPLGLAILAGLRNVLRQQNLYDTTGEPAVNQPDIGPMQARYLTERTGEGIFNDLENPRMGMAGSRFGRNSGGAIVLRRTSTNTDRQSLSSRRKIRLRLLRVVRSRSSSRSRNSSSRFMPAGRWWHAHQFRPACPATRRRRACSA